MRWDLNQHTDTNRRNILQACHFLIYSVIRKHNWVSQLHEDICKFTFSSFPLFCWSFFSRLRTAFPLSLGFREDGRWEPLTAALTRLLWPLQSLHGADWRFLGPGEGLISCNICKKPQCKVTGQHYITKSTGYKLKKSSIRNKTYFSIVTKTPFSLCHKLSVYLLKTSALLCILHQ